MKSINRQIFYLIHRPIKMRIAKRTENCEGYQIFRSAWWAIK